MIHEQTPEQRAAHECVLSHMRGFRDGATASAMRPEFTGHAREDMSSAYRRGYNDGAAARRIAHATACAAYGYEWTGLEVLR